MISRKIKKSKNMNSMIKVNNIISSPSTTIQKFYLLKRKYSGAFRSFNTQENQEMSPFV